jgi:hypothetical protein
MKEPSRRETTIGRATDEAQLAACRAFAVQSRAGRRLLGRVGDLVRVSPATRWAPCWRRCNVAARPGQASVAVLRRGRAQAPRWPGWAGCERAVARLTTHATQGRRTVAEGPGGAVEAWTVMGRWRGCGSEIRKVSIVTRPRCRMFVSSALAVGVPCSPRWRCPSASRVAQDRDRVLGDADVPP